MCGEWRNFRHAENFISVSTLDAFDKMGLAGLLTPRLTIRPIYRKCGSATPRGTRCHFESASTNGTALFVTCRERRLLKNTACRLAIRSFRICVATRPRTVLDGRLAHATAKQLAKSIAVGQSDASRHFVGGQRSLREQLARTLDPDSLQILGGRCADVRLKVAQQRALAHRAGFRCVVHGDGAMTVILQPPRRSADSVSRRIGCVHG